MADILQRPVMSFVLQWNDLESLQVRHTGTSVTRFGEISPLWHHFKKYLAKFRHFGIILKNIWQFLEGLFSVRQNFDLTFAK